ncbi:MAG: hydrogenase 4 subunit B [Tatlockia sp.]|jgi:formate hydrogenlyase subunit 3/multisubunit Na+/H+ antiporter MnhD subunit
MYSPLILALGITLYWILLGIVGGLLLRYKSNNTRIFFLLGLLGSILLLFSSVFFLNNPPYTLALPVGIPGFPLHFCWDALSAFFVLLLSMATIGIGLFSSHYFRHVDSRTQSLLFFNYHWFLASMVWVFLAADAFGFLMAWEFMALSSYFLIVAFKSSPETSFAGFLYLLIAHLGAVAILFDFTIMSPAYLDFTFDAMRHGLLTSTQANLAFIFALIGFGAKAGLLPMHVWLPEAHPAAPSPISALMSGVMLKTAIYGMLRVFFDLLSNQTLAVNCGLIVLLAGLLTALLGVILSAMQTDMKRLLAYSSIENMGIIVFAIGLALLFNKANLPVFAALALVAALFHCFNHSLFKSLLFLCTGNVLHATGERNLGKLGGLIASMPRVAVFALIGTLAMAGIPPLNGFFSEWLLVQALLFSPKIPTPYLAMLIPVATAAFALSVGLAAYVMVKFYGIIFLGKPRETKLTHAKDAALFEQLGLGWFAVWCILIGLFPFPLLQRLNHLSATLLNQPVNLLSNQGSWLFLTPTQFSRGSYSPFLLFCVIALIVALLYLVIRWLYHGQYRHSAAWDCGYPLQTARMQDSAEGFGQPIKHIFSQFLYVRLEIPTVFDKTPVYSSETNDRFWYLLYWPVLRLTFIGAKLVSKLQQGRISYYLLYSFITLLLLLWWSL